MPVHKRSPGRVRRGTLAEIAEWCRDGDIEFDHYGDGELIQAFEAEVAEKLGYPAARFMPSGTMAQQIALRVWCERSGVRHVGMHPTAHVELHEDRGYSHLHSLQATLVGPGNRPMLADHIAGPPESFGAVLVELPTREAGGQLPTCEELGAIKATARERGVRLHLDGARLWECGPAYQRSYAEICDGFDSTYVSFYKGNRCASGLHAPRPRGFHRRGGDMATEKRRQPLHPHSKCRLGSHAVGDAPFKNAGSSGESPPDRGSAVVRRGGDRGPRSTARQHVHFFLDLDLDSAIAARDRVAKELQLWLFGWAAPAEIPGKCWSEVYVGENAMGVSDDEIDRAFRALMRDSGV